MKKQYTADELEKLEQEGKTCKKDCKHYQACTNLYGGELGEQWPLCYSFKELLRTIKNK